MPGAGQGHIPRIHGSRGGQGDTGQALLHRWGRDGAQEQSHDVG